MYIKSYTSTSLYPHVRPQNNKSMSNMSTFVAVPGNNPPSCLQEIEVMETLSVVLFIKLWLISMTTYTVATPNGEDNDMLVIITDTFDSLSWCHKDSVPYIHNICQQKCYTVQGKCDFINNSNHIIANLHALTTQRVAICMFPVITNCMYFSCRITWLLREGHFPCWVCRGTDDRGWRSPVWQNEFGHMFKTRYRIHGLF